MSPVERLLVIDNPAQVEPLIAKLKAALPLSATVAREIAAYQKHRIKRIRRGNGPGASRPFR